ncbi:MAG: hypothetical protein NUW02_00545 [Candidatus Campbellbacteria bacterium]|nr:hypothetical protein [Candidatus Campbellbacteria bacterium]
MEESIKLSFEYSKSLEKERVINTIKRLPWYRDNRYNVDIIAFPKNLDTNNLVSTSDEDILNAIDLEYNQEKHISSEKEMTKLFSLYEGRLVSFLKETELPIISNIIVHLVMYGTAGSYSLPNKVIVNISKFYNVGLMRNILHEIIHLHIQHLIDTYKIGQWEKERVVDLLMEKCFPEITKQQHIQIDTTKIDEVFNTHYPNVPYILETIGEISR